MNNNAIANMRKSTGWGDVFDQLLNNDLSSHDLFETFRPFETKNPSFPPYNIIKEDEGEYKIEMALAGFTKKDLEIILDKDILTVSSIKDKNRESPTESNIEKIGTTYVHRGMARREFSSKFRLPEYSEVSDCKMQDGVLTIQVSRNIPEEKLPKVIKIS